MSEERKAPMFRIICDPEILGDKPVVEGTRLSVEHILGLLSHGMSRADIVRDYPGISEEDINEVLRYAAEALHNDVVVDVRSRKGAE